MSISRKDTPFTFREVRKQTPEGRFDLEATLGEIVKVTFNRYMASIGKSEFAFTGTFRVTLNPHYDKFWIRTNNKADQLLLLKSWTGCTYECIDHSGDHSVSFTEASTFMFDCSFIMPFVRELREELNGMHPFEVMVFKAIQNENFAHIDNTVMPFFNEKRETVVKTRAGEVVLFESRTPLRFSDFSDMAVTEIDRASKANNQELKEFIETHAFTQGFNTRTPISNYINDKIFQLGSLARWYREFSDETSVPSLYQDITATIINEIINRLLPSIAATDLLKTGIRIPVYHMKGQTQLHNLLNLGNLDLTR